MLQHNSTILNVACNSTLASGINDAAYLNATQPKEELKTTFVTKEGTYRIMTLAEYSKPNRGSQMHMPMGNAGGLASAATSNVGMYNQGVGASVKVSFVTIPKELTPSTSELSNSMHQERQDGPIIEDDTYSDKICFNVGRELYIYPYRGTNNSADLSRPLDKRVYKGTFPTAHSFNQQVAKPTSCSLIIGFSTGQLQLIDPLNKEFQASRLFNEERAIDKTAVTCVKWVPGQKNMFIASYISGNMYVFNDELQCSQTSPTYQMMHEGEKYAVYSCKTKTTKNPMARWQIGDGAIHDFEFSGPDAKMFATVGHDGFLRIFNYQKMELLSSLKSYFGALLSLSWSPDAKLIATGGEDDLLTVYSVQEKRVVCRGHGHKSWISQVKFDTFCCTTAEEAEKNRSTSPIRSVERVSDYNKGNGMTPPGSIYHPRMRDSSSRSHFQSLSSLNGNSKSTTEVCYRIGTVGHDTQLCLWDITEDMLQVSNIQRHRNSTIIAPFIGLEISNSYGARLDTVAELAASNNSASTSTDGAGGTNGQKKGKKQHKRRFTMSRFGIGTSNSSTTTTNRKGEKKSDSANTSGAVSPTATGSDVSRLLGTNVCPRIEDVPMIEPLMCKKIAHERLTVLEFRPECVITACQEGFICTWARPGTRCNPVKKDFVDLSESGSPADERHMSRTMTIDAQIHHNWSLEELISMDDDLAT